MTITTMFPKEISALIASYIGEYQLRDWIPREKLNHSTLYANPVALEAGWIDLHDDIPLFLFFNPHPRAIDHIIKHSYAIEWFALATNPGAADILLKNLERISIKSNLCMNSDDRIVQYLLEHPEYIDVHNFGRNSNDAAFRYYLNNIIKNSEYTISSNPHPSAIEILQSNPKIIWWHGLSQNPHPWAMKQLELNPDKINWSQLSKNPSIFIHTDLNIVINLISSIAW